MKNKANPQIIELNQKISDLTEKLARTLADYSNLEKRVESQRQMLITMATASFLNKIIPVLDDLTLAQSHLNDPGLKMSLDKLRQVVKSEGIQEISPNVGDSYDELSMSCLTTAEGEDGKVLVVHKVGYKLNDQVIRPAEVVVGKKNTDLNPES